MEREVVSKAKRMPLSSSEKTSPSRTHTHESSVHMSFEKASKSNTMFRSFTQSLRRSNASSSLSYISHHNYSTSSSSPVPQQQESSNIRPLQHLQHTVDSTHSSTLKNGIQVHSRDHLGGASQISVKVNVGARDETYENAGVSHYVQRFFFGPTINRTYVNLTSTFQNIGADVSAQHGREEIVYTSTQLRDASPVALELMSDSIVYARLHDWDMGSKRRLVEDDIEQFKQYPDLVLDELLHATAFGHRGLGNSLSCPEDNLNKITIQQVRDFMDNHYTGENMSIVGTNVEHDALVSMAETLFEEVPKTADQAREHKPSHYYGGSAQCRDSSFIPGEETVRAALAFKGFARGSADYYNSLVLKHVLGSLYRMSPNGPKSTTAGGELGILAGKVKEFSTDVTRVEPFSHAYSDTGLFGIKLSGFKGPAVGEAIYGSLAAIMNIHKEGVPELLLNYAKRRAAIELAQPSSSMSAEHEYILQNPSGEESQDSRRVLSARSEDIQRMAGELLQSNPTVVSHGEVDGVPYAL